MPRLLPLFLLVLVAGCGSDPAPQQSGDGDISDAGGDSGDIAIEPDLSPPACDGSDECESDDGVGQICVAEQCVACEDHDDCVGDAHYGPNAVCTEDGVCEQCSPGDELCLCIEGDYCVAGMGCGRDDTCEECLAGEALCACDEGDCDGRLACVDGYCVEAGCTPGEAECVCDLGACDPGLTCGVGICRECPTDAAGCPCDDGVCSGDLACESGTCQPGSCLQVECGEHVLCDDDDGTAACLNDCESDYLWDAELMGCVPDVSCDPGNLLDTCDGENRVCVDTADGAECGECKSGFAEDENDDCVALPACEVAACADANRACVVDGDSATCGACVSGYIELGDTCHVASTVDCGDGDNSLKPVCDAASADCVELSGGGANCVCPSPLVRDPETQSCVTAPTCADSSECSSYPGTVCAVPPGGSEARCVEPRCGPLEAGVAGEAWNDSTDSCVLCAACVGEGTTGLIWPFTDNGGVCLCESNPGYFFNTDGRRANFPCDADDDGWLTETARSAMDSSDSAVRLNARCDLRTIDRVVLHNDYGQSRTLRFPVVSGFFHDMLPLYEGADTDVDDDDATKRPAYGGRRFDASELNPFTRACVTARADYNDNGVSDVTEHQDLASGLVPFARFTYFVEQHYGYYEAPDSGEHGSYHIHERSRCAEETFPFGYDRAADTHSTEGPYWRSCFRRRAGDYTDRPRRLGVDFQEWSPAGELPRPENVALPPPGAALEPDHGVCDPRPEFDATRPCTGDSDCRVDEACGAGSTCERRTCAGDGDCPSDTFCTESGVCEFWYGMNHASQFRCVTFEATEDQVDENNGIWTRDVWEDVEDDHEQWQVNQCEVQTCADDDLDCLESRTWGVGPNPADPVVVCRSSPDDLPGSIDDLDGAVGWVAARFDRYANDDDEDGYNYDGYGWGCIDEQAEWRELCPGFVANPRGTLSGANIENHGKLYCGCDYNYGGIDCNLGCPGLNPTTLAEGASYSDTLSMVFYGGDVEPGAEGEEVASGRCDAGYCPISFDADGAPLGRRGYWMCGVTTASAPVGECTVETVVADCGAGNGCVAGVCRDACAGDEPACPNGLTCSDGNLCLPDLTLTDARISTFANERRLLGEGSGTGCANHEECLVGGEACVAGVCLTTTAAGGSCAETSDCPSGQVCVGSICHRSSGWTLR